MLDSMQIAFFRSSNGSFLPCVCVTVSFLEQLTTRELEVTIPQRDVPWESISSFLNEFQAIVDSAVEGLDDVDNVSSAAKQHLLKFWLLRGQVWAPDHVAEFESIIASCRTEDHGPIFISTGMFNDPGYFLGTLQRGGVSG
jgi:hypothetical protein